MRFRLTQPKDFHIARDFVPLAYRYSRAAFDALPDLWTDLLRSGQLTSAVLEDMGGSSGEQVLGVGLSVFVNDAFASAVLDDPAPYVNARLHDMILAGRSPILTRRQIADANTRDGLNLLPLHFCTRSVDIQDQTVMRTLSAAHDLFRVMHSGYNVKLVVKEVVNVQLCRFMQSTGMNLAYDYAAARPELGLEGVPEQERPYLLAIRRDEMPLGSAMSLMFITSPARFHFSPAEQKLILCALLRDSDGDIAGDLSRSHDTLHKNWKSIYQRVLAVDPCFFPEKPDTKSNGNGNGRGVEKRRYLLRYIQTHMEELRPHNLPALRKKYA